MSIILHEALKLEQFKDFKIVAGKAGLTNKIKKIGILDYETKEMIEKNFEEGEFAISTLLVVKDKIEELYEIVETLILIGASGLAVKNIYFNKLPDEVIELANSRDFPIFIFSNIYFEDIITTVTDVIKAENESEALALKIDNILYSNLNNVLIKKIAYEINRNFRENNIVIFCKIKKAEKSDDIGILPRINNIKLFNELCTIVPFKEGYLIINTFENIEIKDVEQIILSRLEILGFSSEYYNIGISSLYKKIEELNLSIKESMYAFKHSITYNKAISFFSKIGTNKILLPLIENQWIQKYYEEMITPLIIHDKKNDSELLKTAITYIENNGDIKSTAKELFQHSNTIRYRIDKIYKILNRNCDIEHFYEELAVAVRIHKLLT